MAVIIRFFSKEDDERVMFIPHKNKSDQKLMVALMQLFSNKNAEELSLIIILLGENLTRNEWQSLRNSFLTR